MENGDNGNNGDELDCKSDEGPDDGPDEGKPESAAITETEMEAEVTPAQDGGEIETDKKAGEEPDGEESKRPACERASIPGPSIPRPTVTWTSYPGPLGWSIN